MAEARSAAMSTREFYEARAAECARDAAAATLDNVRDRALRSQAAWLEMAGRIARTDALRAKTEAAKAEAAREDGARDDDPSNEDGGTSMPVSQAS